MSILALRPRKSMTFAASLDLASTSPQILQASVRPCIDGAGLTQAEWFKMNGRRNEAMYRYAADMPDASPGEIDAVGARAATDALRQILRDRPEAAPLPCCGPAEPTPCQGCLDAAPVALADPGDLESDPSTWPDWTDNWHWSADLDPDDDEGTESDLDPIELLTLDQHIDREAAQLRRYETHAGDLMAKALVDLAELVRLVQARTPGEAEARIGTLEPAEHFEPEPVLLAGGQWGHDA